MCFNHDDYDWVAWHVEDTTTTATVPTRCDECGRTVHPGELLRHVYQQEREDGEYCEPDKGEHVGGCDGTACEHEGPGESYSWSCCSRCDRLLKAIKAAELAEGCGEHESQPAFGELRDAMREDLDNGEGRYADAAREAFPDLAFSGHLDRYGDDPDDLYERLAYGWSARYRRTSLPHGEYPNAACGDDQWGPSAWLPPEHGGEGG